jgi:hypothetical protein
MFYFSLKPIGDEFNLLSITSGVVDVTTEEIQEVAEELATMLGVVLETKIRVVRIITRLETLP